MRIFDVKNPSQPSSFSWSERDDLLALWINKVPFNPDIGFLAESDQK
jgi:hypothetical protein